MEAQQDARLALDKLRREIHCASSVTSNNATTGGTWPATGGTRAITVKLGSYCPSTTPGAISVTWCTQGSGPYTLWRYPHMTDMSTDTYATACSGAGGAAWVRSITDLPTVPGGKIFTSYSQPTQPAMSPPVLTLSATSGSLGSPSADTSLSYVVDPVTAAGEQPGLDARVTLAAGRRARPLRSTGADRARLTAV